MDRCRISALWMFVLVGVTGLSCARHEPLNPVQGKVLQKDQPLSGATVTFIRNNTSDTSVDFPTAITKDDGTYTLRTGGKDGAPAAIYKVTIVCMQEPKTKPEAMSMGPAEMEDRLKGAYADPATSKFSVEIKPGANQLEPFVLP